MNIISIYKKYPVPKILQMHMLRAASIGGFIADNWKNKLIDSELIIQTLLIHDMGNIIKFKLDKSGMLDKEESESTKYWESEQKKYRDKFNNDDHLATAGIAREIGASENILCVLKHSGSSKLRDVIDSNNSALQVVTYADLRCAPFGVVSINKRFDEIKGRYKNTKHSFSDIEEVEKRRTLGLELEQVLQVNLTIDLNSLNDESIKNYIKSLSDYNFPV